MSPNYPRSSEWPKNLWIAPDRANRTLILPAWSNKQPELRLEEGREGGRRNVWCDQAAPGREMMMVVAVVTITICSEHTRNLSPLSLPAPPATLLSWHWIFLSQPRWKPVSQSFGAAEDVWDVNKQDVDWRHFMMLPSSGSGTGPLLWSDGRCFVDISQNQDLSLCLLLPDTSFVLRTQTGRQGDTGPQISEGTSEEIICSRGYT